MTALLADDKTVEAITKAQQAGLLPLCLPLQRPNTDPSANSAQELLVCEPATGAVIARLAQTSRQQVLQQLASAQQAFAEWRCSTAISRHQLLMRWYQAVSDRQAELAALLSCESGKPLAEAQAEIRYAADYIQWFAAEALRDQGDWQAPSHAGRQLVNLKEPVGVVLAITPWNFPAAMVTRKVAAAIAAGCAVLLKPSELTPLTAIALQQLFTGAGFAPDLLQLVITTDAPGITETLLAQPDLRKVSFTGSTRVGQQLLAQSGAGLQRLSLELGGNAPLIVFADADIDAAVAGIMAAKFRNSGQTCVCVNRVLVAQPLHDLLLKKLAAAMQQLSVGCWYQPAVNIGPLIRPAAVSLSHQRVQAALDAGACLVWQHAMLPDTTRFFPPTLLSHVSNRMQVCQQELFAPILTVQSFASEAEVVALANDTDAGLAAYIYGSDERRNFRIASQLQAGMVGINASAISDVRVPFGGVRASGFGREGSAYGLAEYQQIKHLCWQFD